MLTKERLEAVIPQVCTVGELAQRFKMRIPAVREAVRRHGLSLDELKAREDDECPSPEQIAEMCQESQATWSAKERQRRSAGQEVVRWRAPGYEPAELTGVAESMRISRSR